MKREMIVPDEGLEHDLKVNKLGRRDKPKKVLEKTGKAAGEMNPH